MRHECVFPWSQTEGCQEIVLDMAGLMIAVVAPLSPLQAAASFDP